MPLKLPGSTTQSLATAFTTQNLLLSHSCKIDRWYLHRVVVFTVAHMTAKYIYTVPTMTYEGKSESKVPYFIVTK